MENILIPKDERENEKAGRFQIIVLDLGLKDKVTKVAYKSLERRIVPKREIIS